MAESSAPQSLPSVRPRGSLAFVLHATGLWQDVQELPEALAATLDACEGVAEAAALLGDKRVRRVVVSGNGAAYYVAVALWLASLEGAGGPEVVAVPSGLLARGAFRWDREDVLLAVSSSGEFRDLVEAVDAGAPTPYVVVTANAGSTLGSRAGVRVLVRVLNQRAVTHTQAFCGGVAVTLAIWAELTSDTALAQSLDGVAGEVAATLDATRVWLESVADLDPLAAVAFGSGPAWTSALEAALLLKEVAGVPAEGLETREGATSAMMSLQPGHLALSLPTGADPLLDEAEEICRRRGATVLRAPSPGHADRRLAAITSHPAAAALSARIGLRRGLDVDRPAWTHDYYRVARQTV
jgi:fructoselysine-6-P-deglycase FrlB-like protein